MAKTKPKAVDNERLLVILIIAVTVLFTLFIISTAKRPCEDKVGPGLCIDDANAVLCELRIKKNCSISYTEICEKGDCVSEIVPSKEAVRPY